MHPLAQLRPVAWALIAFWLLFASFSAFARDATATWELPTQREDGVPLPVSEIAAVRVEWGTCSAGAFGTQAGVRDVAPPALSTVIALSNGLWCFRAFAVDTDGLISEPSLVVSVHFKGKPKAPVIRSVR